MRILPAFNDVDLSTEEIVRLMVSDGISFQEIAKYVPWGRHHIGNFVGNVKKNSSSPIGRMQQYENSKAICHICHKRTLPEHMASRQHKGIPIYILSFCSQCQDVDPLKNPLDNHSLARKLAAKDKSYRSTYKATLGEMPYGYFAFLYLKQDGKCFYSGEVLSFQERSGLKLTLSADRVIFDGKYEQGNIVLAANKINHLKLDMTLDEMKQWSPKLYDKATYFLATKESFLMGGS